MRDEAAFLIRPNPGMPFGPVAETASGGELSRVALALAVVAGGETLVFDEIDAGIGGVTAHRVAETLSRLAERAQVITITHLPQIANVAERHFRVEKVPGDPTHTRIEELSADERRAELERMLGGEEFLTAIAVRAAAVTEVAGTARLGRRTKDLVKRLRPGRPRDHRPRRPRPRLRRGARRLGRPRRRQRLAVELGAVSRTPARSSSFAPACASSTRRAPTCSSRSPTARP